MAANVPTSHSPIWPPTNTGARSGLPRASPLIAPDHAWSVNSVAAFSTQGPASPKAVIDATIRCGWGREEPRGAERGLLRHPGAA